MIRPSEISKLAHQLGLGDKTIEKDYVLTWVLLAFAASTLCEQLVFKGGTAIKKMYIPDYRYSEDLDFTLLDASLTNDALQVAVEALFETSTFTPWYTHCWMRTIASVCRLFWSFAQMLAS